MRSRQLSLFEDQVNMNIIGVDVSNGKDYGIVLYGRIVAGKMYVEHILRDGEPCAHCGCLSHVSHPCEKCGRIAGRASSISALQVGDE